jgi:hypothetical protein
VVAAGEEEAEKKEAKEVLSLATRGGLLGEAAAVAIIPSKGV